MSKVAVLIAAAGSGSRFGGKTPKQFMEIDGRAVFLRTIEKFAERDDVCEIIIAIPEDYQELFEIKWAAKLGFYGVKTVLGGTQRHQTIANMLAAVSPQAELIAIHDAARPCITSKQIDEVFAAAAKYQAAILAAPIVGTIKIANGDLQISETVDRNKFWQAQTPQVFKAELIRQAYQNPDKIGGHITDDAQLVESLGIAVQIVPGDQANIKITTKVDLDIAQAILKSQQPKPSGPISAFEADNMW